MRRLFRAVLVVLIATIASLFGMGNAIGAGTTYNPVAAEPDLVTTNSVCSLREAVLAARDNAAAPAPALADCGAGSSTQLDTIHLQKGATYTITGSAGQLPISNGAGEGPLEISCFDPSTACTKAVGEHAIITGPFNNTRIMNIAVNGSATLRLIEITGGSYQNGGAMTNSGTITLDRVIIQGNVAVTAEGGGIYNTGTLTITDSQITNNEATNDYGGGIQNGLGGTLTVTNTTIDHNTATNGGGIANNATATLTGVSVTDNTASSGNGGGIWSDHALTIKGASHIDDNDATTSGGGIYASLTSSSVDIQQLSTVNRNTADSAAGIYSPGTLAITLSQVADNIADVSAGGGIYVLGTATISQSRIEGNSAGSGAGGILDYGDLTMSQSTVAENSTTTNGGGIFASNGGTNIITQSTFSGNSAGTGGAIYTSTGTTSLTLANSTLSTNTSTGHGSAIYVNNGGVTMTNDTVKDNTGGIAVYTAVTPITLTNTILDNVTNCGGPTVTSAGHNLETHAQCPFSAAGDIKNGSPNLQALAANGVGPFFPQTHALGTGSQAIDTGDNPTCAAAPVNNKDERGQTRPKNGDAIPGAICDIGAYEAPPGTTTASPSPTASTTPPPTPSPTPTPTGSPASVTPTGSPSSGTPTGSSSETPTSTPTETPTETPTDTPTDTPSSDTPTGSVTDSPTPTPTGVASETPTASPTAAPVLIRGDVKCNDLVDFDDALALLAYLAELSDPLLPGCQYPVGEEIFVGIAWDDTDCDLDVDIIDALNLVLYKAGLPPIVTGSCSPIGEALPIP